MSSLFGSGNNTQNATPASSFKIQTAVAGLPIPIVWGKTRLAPNLIGYTDFKAIAYQTGGGGKGGLAGGGGGGKGGSSTQYSYSVAVELALCEGPIRTIDSVWNNKTNRTLSSMNFVAFTGAYTQAPWGYMTSLHPSKALNYRGLAYAAAGPLQLGSSSELPNLSFEVTDNISYAVSGLPDADPSAVITDLLTSPYYGVGLSAAQIGDLSTYTAYCRAAGMLVSPQITDLTTGQDFIKTLLEATNSEAVWSQGTLEIVPRGDQAFTSGSIVQVTEMHTVPMGGSVTLYFPGVFVADLGVTNPQTGVTLTKVSTPSNTGQYSSAGSTYQFSSGNVGVSLAITYTYTEPSSYTPPSAPQYAFGDDDYVMGSSGASQPVDISRAAPQDQKNSVIVNYLDRSNAYALTPTPAAKDDAAIQAYGLKTDSIRDYHFFCYAQAAQQSAQLLLGRNLVRNTYTFTVGAKYVLLDPMDIVSLTDSAAGLVNKWVRITEITENDDLTLTMSAEEYLAGSAAAPIYGGEPSGGYIPNYNQDPGYINAPVIFEPPSTLTGGDNELWIAVSGASTVWGGCDVFVSYNDTSYAIVPDAHQVGSARHGFLSAALPAGGALDKTNTLSIDISQVPGAQLTSGTLADAQSFATLCYVDGELIAYQTATLTGLGQYNLKTLVRGCYGTPISAHAAGSAFARLDMQIIKIPFNKALIGGGIFLKFVSFNLWGQGGQSISSVTPIDYTFGGGQPPGVLTNVAGTLTQSGLAMTLAASWAPDALSATYQAQVSSDSGVTFAATYEGAVTNFRADGFKAAQVQLRVRGVTSSGLLGQWASITIVSPTLTSDGSGYSQFITYKDMNTPFADSALASGVEEDLNDIAAFVASVQSNTLLTTAFQATNSASVSFVQQAMSNTTAISAQADSLTGLTASIYGNSALIATLQTVSANQTQTIASLQTTVTSNYTDLSGQISSTNSSVSTLAGTVSSQGQSIGSLQTTVSSNYTDLSGKISTTNSNVTSLSSTVSNQGSTLGSLQTTVSSNYTDLNNKSTATNSNLSTTNSNLSTTNSNLATANSNITTLSNQYGSLSTQVTSVTAQSAAGTANGQVNFSAQSAPSGITARFAVTLSASGQTSRTGGMYLDLVSNAVNVTFDAQTFKVQNGATRMVPFAIDSSGNLYLQGVTYIATAVQSQVNVGTGSAAVPAMVLDFVNGAITISDAS